MDFRDRIRVWKETKEAASAYTYTSRPAEKFTYDEGLRVRGGTVGHTSITVVNQDSIEAGRELQIRGLRPLVLIFADHRFAGGDVQNGSGAQEESLFRRTNLCNFMLQHVHYPIFPREALVSKDVTVFRDTEARSCQWIEPYTMDFIACPALHNPRLIDGNLSESDIDELRLKLRLIFQVAYACKNNALVLGPMGCGAWRSPPEQVARIMKEELDLVHGAFDHVTLACLEVNQSDYIVRNRDKPASNYSVFKHVFDATPCLSATI